MNIFWSEIGSAFGEPGGTSHEEFPGVPPGQQMAIHNSCLSAAPDDCFVQNALNCRFSLPEVLLKQYI